jgi:hypothetical protein
MKKLFALILTIAILAMAAAPAFAQGRNRQCNNSARTYNSRSYYDSRANYDNSRAYYDYNNQHRSVWSRHRDKLTVAIGSGAAAAIGAMAGGRRGAIIGALAGAGGSALYTYKIRNRGYRR